MQIKNSFDAVTLKKMGHSALLLCGGTLLTYVSDNFLQLIGAVGIPDVYKPIALSVFTWLINSGKEFLKGKDSKLSGESSAET